MPAIVARIPRKKRASADRREELRDSLWSDATGRVWKRTEEYGFSTIPRTLPLIGTLIRLLTKDLDASRAYFDLWGRVFDEGLVEVLDEEEFAASCGYATAGRNVRTWRERIDALVGLGLVEVRPKSTRKFGYILLIHPHDAVQRLWKTRKKDIPSWWWDIFNRRVGEIGAELRLRN